MKPRRPERPAPSRRRPARPALPALGELLVFAVVLVPPLLVSPGRADAFDLPKLVASEWLGLASLALLAWRLRAAGTIDARRVVRLPVVAATLPLVAVATLGLATSPHPEHVRAALPDLWIGVACLVGWSLALAGATFRRLKLALLAPAVVLAVLGVLQFHDLYRPFEFAAGEEAIRMGVTSLGGNPGVLAAYLVLPALVAQSWLRRAWHRRRWGAVATAGAVTVLCLYGIAVTQTLAALTAVAAASVLLWALAVPPRRALVALGAAAALAVVAVLAVAPLRHRVAVKAEQVVAGKWNRALTGRLDGWRAATWMIARRPLTGIGHGAYDAEFAVAKLDLAERGVPLFSGSGRVMFVNAHDEFLEVGAEWGLAGLAALGWGLWCLAGALRRGGRARDPDRALAWAGVAALAFLALFHFPFRVALVAYPAVVWLAWSFRLGEEEAR